MNVVLAGEESAGLRALDLIGMRDDVRVVLVLSSGRTVAPSLAEVAASRGFRVDPAKRVGSPTLAGELADLGTDLLLNVHSLSIAHADVVAVPRIGSFNLHPGPLPGYAGLNTPSWAIHERASAYGSTLHWMTAEVDAGPIAYSATFSITEEDTGLTLMGRCVRAGVPLLTRLLDDAARDDGSIPRVVQPTPPVNRGAGPPNEGWVEWSQTAERIEAFVRASDYGPFPSPWGRPRATLDGVEVGLVRAYALCGGHVAGAEPGTVLEVIGDEVEVATGGGVLRVSRLERKGERLLATEVATPGARFSA